MAISQQALQPRKWCTVRRSSSDTHCGLMTGKLLLVLLSTVCSVHGLRIREIPRRVIAVGDLHGDFAATLQTLLTFCALTRLQRALRAT